MTQVYPWWYYFSWWYFIWVVLFLMGVVPFSPYFLATLILIYTILKIGSEVIDYFFLNKTKIKREKLVVIAIWLLLVFSIDVFPFFILKRDMSWPNIYFTMTLIIVYLIFMWYKKVDVVNLYTFQRYKFLSENYSPMELIKAHFPYFS
jgi:hypothetical protein